MDPFIENQERQKRFITNASHELKTPLTVISANTEMIEMTGSKSKWTESTKRQTQKMSQLVSNLVTLSKLDEKDEVVLSKVNASKIVSEQAEPFTSVIESSGRKFETQITPDLLIMSESRGVQELVSILLDNAAKYCDEEGRIFLKFEAVGKPGKDGLTARSSRSPILIRMEWELIIANSLRDSTVKMNHTIQRRAVSE
jgi:signal transduction histidine kinase